MATKTSRIQPVPFESNVSKAGNEKERVFSSDFENVGKTLIASIPPSGGPEGSIGFLVGLLTDE